MASMHPPPDSIALEIGPSRLILTPPWPPLWMSLSSQALGPAGLCLALLPLAAPVWEGVAWSGGGPAPPTPEALAALPAGLWPRLLGALCQPWLTPGEEEEIKALERHLRARADFPGLDCGACREQEERGEGSPDCGACPRAQAPRSAQAALGLHALLADLPPAGRAWAGEMWRSLPPRQAWRLAGLLACIQRWRPAGPAPCALFPGRGNMD